MNKLLYSLINKINLSSYPQIKPLATEKNVSVELSNNNFISPEINKRIMAGSFFHDKYKFTANKSPIELNIYNPKRSVKLNKRIIDRIFVLCGFIDSSRPSAIDRPISIDIYVIDVPKKVKSKVLGPDDANSGSTMMGSSSRHVMVWRKEELLKVLIHELMHALDLDTFKNPTINKRVTDNFNINCAVHITESYTELMACVLNMLINMKDIGIPIELYSQLIQYELDHSCKKTHQILNHYGITDFRELYRGINNNKYNEDTNIFMYYIVKSIMLYRHDRFIELAIPKILGSSHSNFENLYLNLIFDILDNTDYITHINKLLKQRQNYTDFRMTYFG